MVKETEKAIIVTRHPALVRYLIEIGLADETTPVIPHASEEEVQGKDVIGVLPIRLAVHAATVTEVPLDLPADMRGKELSIEDVRRYAGKPETYIALKWKEYV